MQTVTVTNCVANPDGTYYITSREVVQRESAIRVHVGNETGNQIDWLRR